jgi:hypothetical protein
MDPDVGQEFMGEVLQMHPITVCDTPVRCELGRYPMETSPEIKYGEIANPPRILHEMFEK